MGIARLAFAARLLQAALCIAGLCGTTPALGINIGFFWETDDPPIPSWDPIPRGRFPASSALASAQARCDATRPPGNTAQASVSFPQFDVLGNASCFFSP